MAVARHNNKPTRHSANAQKTGTRSDEIDSSSIGCPARDAFAGTQIKGPSCGQHQRPGHSANFRNESGWDPPWLPKVMPCSDNSHWAGQKTTQTVPTRPSTQYKVVSTHCVIGPIA